MSAPQPTAQGTLESRPLAHVMLTIVDRALTGTLAVWPDDERRGQDRIYFEGGVPKAAVLLEPASTLERGLLPLFRRQRAPWAFYPADLVTEIPQAITGDADPYLVLAASLRGGARAEVIDSVLARFGDERIRIRRGAPLDRFQFIPRERAFLDVLRAEPQTVADLIRRSVDPKTPRRMLYLLTITRCVEIFTGEYSRTSFTEAAQGRLSEDMFRSKRGEPEADEEFGELPGLPSDKPPMGAAPEPEIPAAPRVPAESPPPAAPNITSEELKREGPKAPPAPPSGIGQSLLARWREIADYAVEIDGLNYFEMLGVPTSAGADAIQKAYFEKVKKWHPDRLPTDLHPLKPWVDVIFHHLTEAQKILEDQDKRSKYLKDVQGGGGTPEADRRVAELLAAATEFQKVEVLTRKKQYDEAIAILNDILQTAPEEPDYHAMKGLLIYKASGGQDKADRMDALRCLDKALELHDRHEKALMTKAQILQRFDQNDKAHELYEKVLEINPKNVDAERQVRLARMRASGGPKKKKSDSSDGGFLGKLFGSKKK